MAFLRNFEPILRFGLIFTACNQQDLPRLRSLIDGAWQSRCASRQDFFSASRVDVDFKDARDFQWREIYYADSDCQQPAAELAYEGSFELAVSTRDFYYKVDLQFAQTTLVALSRDGQTKLQDLEFCGVSTWEIGERMEPRNFDPLTCTALGTAPFKNFNVLKILKGQSLIFAEKIAPDNQRPTELDPACKPCLFEVP